MMEELRRYMIRVIAAALICGILPGLLTKSFAQDMIRRSCGLFLAIVVLFPVSGYNLPNLTDLTSGISDSAAAVASEGENMRLNAMKDIISAEAEAYILDKAAELNVDLSVEVFMSDQDPAVPTGVILYGSVPPYAKQQLQTFLQSQLGIAKEKQQWTGE